MRFWNEWADEHWDMLALALAFTMALAFAAAMAVAFNALTTRLGEPTLVPTLSVTRAVDDAPTTLETATP